MLIAPKRQVVIAKGKTLCIIQKMLDCLSINCASYNEPFIDSMENSSRLETVFEAHDRLLDHSDVTKVIEIWLTNHRPSGKAEKNPQ